MNPYVELLQEQQKTNKLLSVLVTRGLTQTEQIVILSGVGFKPSEIASLIGTTPNTVSVALAKSRTKKKGRK